MNAAFTQSELNDTMERKARENYRSRLSTSIKVGRETATPPVQHLLRSGVASLTASLTQWIADESNDGLPCKPNAIARALRTIEPESAAFIAVQAVLDQLSTQRTYLTIAYRIARLIEEEGKFALLEKERPNEWKDIVRERNMLTGRNSLIRRREALWKIIGEDHDDVLKNWKPWDRRICYRIGTLLIELMSQATNIIEVKYVPVFKPRSRVKRQAMVAPTEECVAWLTSKHADQEILLPYFLPMVVEPEPWKSQRIGGYPANSIANLPLFRVTNRQLSRLTPEAMPKVYEAVNHIQRTCWAINEDVRRVVDYLWKEMGGGVAGLPGLDPEELPSLPTDKDFDDDTQVAKDWKRNAAMTHVRNRSGLSKRILTAKVLQEAETFSRQPIWYPHKYDFRGRVYPIAATGLSPQGTDLSKGLLRFSEGMEIKTEAGERWFYIHGANCWGADKVTFDERAQWVEENKQLIINCASDPFGYPEWAGADSPFQFLAWCFDAAAYFASKESGEPHYSTTPIAMDGSNNGLQLYALLSRDPICAEATNVLPGDKPNDIYQKVADVATEYLKSAAFSDTAETWVGNKLTAEEVREYSRDWLAFMGGRVMRSVTKRPVMVLPYGGTLYSCREYVDDWFSGEIKDRGLINKRPFRKSYKHVLLLARMIWKAIDGMVAAPVEVMEWLQKVSVEFTKAGKPITWETPSGFLVSQSNFTSRKSQIKLRIGGKMIVRNAEIPTKKYSRAKQRNGIAPNFIHGLDAAVMAHTVLKCKELGIRDLGVVHDSFATHAEKCPQLAGALRQSAFEIFSEDVLGNFKEECEEQLGVELPPLPSKGTLDIGSVLRSLYFYS